MAALVRKFRLGGLTLLEVLVASGMLVTVLIMLIGVFVGGLHLMQRSEVYTDASSIAREVMETIDDEGGFSALPLESRAFNGANPDPREDGFPPEPYPKTDRSGREFVVRVESRLVPSSGAGPPRMAAVLVTVTWEGGRIQLEKMFHAANSVL